MNKNSIKTTPFSTNESQPRHRLIKIEKITTLLHKKRPIMRNGKKCIESFIFVSNGQNGSDRTITSIRVKTRTSRQIASKIPKDFVI